MRRSIRSMSQTRMRASADNADAGVDSHVQHHQITQATDLAPVGGA
jgi:hypothetical protein